MKKVLLTACAALAAMTASADVYTFIADGCAPVRAAQANQSHVTMIPLGYYGVKPGSHDSGEHISQMQTPKALVSDAVKLEDMAEGNYVVYGAWRMLQNVPVKVTPAAGLTVTGIKIQGSVPNYNPTMSVITLKDEGYDIVKDFTVNKEDTTNTWTGTYAEPFLIACTGATGSYHMRACYLEITVEGTSTQVGIPVCNKTLPIVAKNELISLSCPTEGAKIYYTISYDGSTKTPTTESTLYTGPFTLAQDGIVRAIAVKDGMTTSFETYNEFYVVGDNVGVAAKFDFTDFTSLEIEAGKYMTAANLNNSYPITTGTSTYSFKNKSFVNNGTKLTGLNVTNSQVVVSAAYGMACEYRTTKLNTGFIVEAPADKALKAILVQGSWLKPYALAEGYTGTFGVNPINASNMLWKAPESEAVSKVSIINTENASRYISRVYVLTEGVTTDVEGIEADMIDENAPIEYYNLQGVRVANPQGGIFIKRQGAKVTKVLVK